MPATAGLAITPGVRTLFCLRVVQPSMFAFRRNQLNNFTDLFISAQNDPLLITFEEHLAAQELRLKHQREAVLDMCTLLTCQGGALADVTPASILQYTHDNRLARCRLQPGQPASNRLFGHGMWTALITMGRFPASTPTTMRAAMMRGQRTIEELVDQYGVRDQAVRDLLIDYFGRRRADLDYSSLKQLALLLVKHFWVKIEQLNPGQQGLRIAPDLYTRWRETIRLKDDGSHRMGQDDIVISVRSFYYDLHTWAADEPERWAAWVAPCPVPPGELHGLGVRRRKGTERSADRTRQRQPLLPVLVEHVESRYDQARLLLERAELTADGKEFTYVGTAYRRVISESDQKLLRHGDAVPTRVMNLDSGELVNISSEEEGAFWGWAAVETLRHSGVRIEELCELTHLSVRQYQRANGEVIALLVIAPSKTDRERVIPMSAKLFHVIASIIRRHGRRGKPIPLVSRYDPHDKVWSAPMPFLFQRQNGAIGSKIFNPGTIQKMISRRCEALAETHPGFRGLQFTPHDFRRIFATELVNSGVPIHIGAALLGTSVSRPPAVTSPSRRGCDPPLPGPPPTETPGPTLGRVPGRHRAGVDRVRGALRPPQGRTRLLRAALWDPLPTRTRLHPLPNVARQPQDAAPPRGAGGRPPGPSNTRRSRGLGRRDRRHRPHPHLPPSQARRSPAHGTPTRCRPRDPHTAQGEGEPVRHECGAHFTPTLTRWPGPAGPQLRGKECA